MGPSPPFPETPTLALPTGSAKGLQKAATFAKSSIGMNDDLRLDQPGEQLVKGFEKCSLRAYICPAGKLTIGWGHTNDHGRQFTAGAVWTADECEAAFREDMFGFECHVRALVKVPLTQGQFSALVSFAYNCGWGGLQHSTLLAKLNRQDYAGAAREFLKWTRGGRPLREFAGLVRRRHAEQAMFLAVPSHTITFTPADVHDMPQAVSPPIAPAVPTAPALVSGGFVATVLTSISDKLKSLPDFTVLTDPVVILCGLALVTVGFLYWQHCRAHREAHA